MSTPSTKEYDLLILVDATYSMSNYLESLRSSLPNIISISTLTDAFSRIGLLAYRDYCDKELIDWSGWLDPKLPADGQPDIIAKAQNLEPIGGGDYPEATKTGLAKAYEVMRPEATTIILLYTDAPPHIKNGPSEYYHKEQKALLGSETRKMFADWTLACRTLQKDKVARVFSILERNMLDKYGRYYNYLSDQTGGTCLYLFNSTSDSISEVTIDVLLTWMQVEKPGAKASGINAILHRYIKRAPYELKDESLLAESKYFEDKNIEVITRLDSEILKAKMPKRETPIQDFAKRYASDAAYKDIVVKQLKKIISDNVSAISLNPVFGSLWRAVCNDRNNPERDDLIQSFGLQVDRIPREQEKTRMKEWLAESYDYTAEVLEIISTVSENEMFPCVYLDPTMKFEMAKDVEEDEEARPITEFTRNELLEIGRTCDYKILRRLGRVLTRLSFANSPEELPAHIAKTKDEELIRIPLALAKKELGRKFWKILLHIVVNGTMLSSRPAALLAALTIKLGIQPLLEAADVEMLMWRDKWNDLEIPETWNTSCLSLLLDADKAYIARQAEHAGEPSEEKAVDLLNPGDRELFNLLVSYKMLELNLKTTLTAKVGWAPEKSSMPLGPVVKCKSCDFPRSVTIMASDGTCGLCQADDFASKEERETRISTRVSKEDTEQTNATWVECGMKNCRAQYVVYHPHELNVRPKCHYCRLAPPSKAEDEAKTNVSPAPCIECKQCLNRMIWPEEYRPNSMDDFTCIACSHDIKSIIEKETTANQLAKENGTTWLLRNKDNTLPEPFNGRSLFHTISAVGTTSFSDNVILFPDLGANLSLNLDGKPLHNAVDVRAQLTSWVTRRRTESGTCSLCFSSVRKDLLLPACGRSGCAQRVCKDCMRGWYGLNAPGRIINTSALSCPFCRRAPTGKTLARYGMGIHYVGNLRGAVEQSGEWVYAWCGRCAFAKPYVERSCAAGAPTEVADWKCEECRICEDGDVKRMECPGCGVLTEKTDGCDHIECPVSTCGVHWCFFCGKESTEEDIYGHMQFEHGGYYDAE
jgi:hypothetical protein